jgi:sulfonate transport system permease protein
VLERPVVNSVDTAPVAAAVVSQRRRRWVRSIIVAAVLPIVLVVLWQTIATSGPVASYRLPTPLSVWTAGVDLYDRGVLYQHVAISTQRALLGFAIGSIVGLALAFALAGSVGQSARISEFFAPTLGALRAVLSLA